MASTSPLLWLISLPSRLVAPDDTYVQDAIGGDSERVLEPPAVLKPLHPRGLRAFPAEVRAKIFKEVSAESDEIPSNSDGFLAFLSRHDKQLYSEALQAYFSINKLTICGGQYYDPPMYPHPGGRMMSAEQTFEFIRKLHINFTYGDYGSPVGDPFIYHSFHLYFSKMPLSNVRDLTIDFSGLRSQAMAGVIHPLVVRNMVLFFRSLKKVSVVVRGGYGPQYEDTLDLIMRAHDQGVRPSFVCYRHWPEIAMQVFENQGVDDIQQALGVNPKIADIRPVTDEFDMQREVVFLEHVYYTRMPYPVTWFWEAEKGKTLVWRDEVCIPGWRGDVRYHPCSAI